MYVIHFRLFAGQLTVDTTGGDYLPLRTPLLVQFTLKGEHTKHNILKEFCRYLKLNDIDWLKPYDKLNEEWLINLSSLKDCFKILQKEKYLTGTITLEPEYKTREYYDTVLDDDIIVETNISFRIDPNELFIYSNSPEIDYSSDIKDSLHKFEKDFPNNRRCGFLMMKYEDSSIQTKIIGELKFVFKKNDLFLLRADEKQYSDDLLTNIRTYMHACYFGVAVFERINSEYFNPNVSLEIGYMMALKKPILFLKEKTLKSLHTDLVGKLYEEFDFQNHSEKVEKSVIRWLKNHDII